MKVHLNSCTTHWWSFVKIKHWSTAYGSILVLITKLNKFTLQSHNLAGTIGVVNFNIGTGASSQRTLNCLFTSRNCKKRPLQSFCLESQAVIAAWLVDREINFVLFSLPPQQSRHFCHHLTASHHHSFT